MRVPLRDTTIDLTVVIPTLNEGPNLEQLLPLLIAALREMNVAAEVLVVDGNSTDDTRAIAAREGATYVIEDQPGYGAAILRGVAEARGAYILTMDADQSHPADVVRTLWAVRDKADITIASRYVPGGRADQPFGRLVLSRILNGFFGKGLDIPVKDLSSGFRLYRKTVFRRLDLDFTNIVVLIDILLKAHALGFAAQEVPFHYRPRGSGSSKASILKFGHDYLRLFTRVWKIRNSVSFPDYDWRAHNSRLWLRRYRQRARCDILMRFTPPKVSTCDIGCGSSHILAAMPHAVGVDLRNDKLTFMRRTNRLLVQGDGMRLPFGDDLFDCVISGGVIEHIRGEGGRHIDECTRVLKPGGILVLGTPDNDRWEWNVLEWMYKKVKPDAYGDEPVTLYTFESLSAALRARGYEIVEHDYIGRRELLFKARKAGPLDHTGASCHDSAAGQTESDGPKDASAVAERPGPSAPWL